eukprot:CAMPEP_0184500270 /NCGR_PEP_ID=MMETSP0113_2-20130426/44163_1 /TAXON_ID=91329 /ORGANISM="Norrisiella sphaerica, Strain BC52" /LENGTH=257 /DNA_ID=CAMNT_0026888561 /DNA_START=90 /DNA_END=863 /DNA_ORIENTATION=+
MASTDTYPAALKHSSHTVDLAHVSNKWPFSSISNHFFITLLILAIIQTPSSTTSLPLQPGGRRSTSNPTLPSPASLQHLQSFMPRPGPPGAGSKIYCKIGMRIWRRTETEERSLRVYSGTPSKKAIMRNRKKKLDKWKRKDLKRRDSNRSEISGNIHRDLRRRGASICYYCGVRGQHLTIDHILPRSKGGLTTMKNVVLACQRCNQMKAAHSVTEAALALGVDGDGRRFLKPHGRGGYPKPLMSDMEAEELGRRNAT